MIATGALLYALSFREDSDCFRMHAALVGDHHAFKAFIDLTTFKPAETETSSSQAPRRRTRCPLRTALHVAIIPTHALDRISFASTSTGIPSLVGSEWHCSKRLVLAVQGLPDTRSGDASARRRTRCEAR